MKSQVRGSAGKIGGAPEGKIRPEAVAVEVSKRSSRRYAIATAQFEL